MAAIPRAISTTTTERSSIGSTLSSTGGASSSGPRLNASFYLARPSATSFELREGPERRGLVRSERRRAGVHSRYLTTIYPAKLWLTYTQPGIEATAGDFYAQLGRGLVFSVRKMDELAIDTTLRGGRLVLDKDFQLFRLGGHRLRRADEPAARR